MAPVEKEEMLRIRASSPLKNACEFAARAAGLTFSDWARAVLARAASERWLALPKGATRNVKKRKSRSRAD